VPGWEIHVSRRLAPNAARLAGCICKPAYYTPPAGLSKRMPCYALRTFRSRRGIMLRVLQGCPEGAVSLLLARPFLA